MVNLKQKFGLYQSNDSKSIIPAAGMTSNSLNEDKLGPLGNRRCKSYELGQRYIMMNGQFSLTKPVEENEILRRQLNRTGLPEDPESKNKPYISWFLGTTGNFKDNQDYKRSKSAIISKNEV